MDELVDDRASLLQAQLRKATGLMRSELEVTTKDDPRALLHSSGNYVVPKVDLIAGMAGKKERRPFVEDNASVPAAGGATGAGRASIALPKELSCDLCHDMLRDAVVISCCGASYCDECIRQRLIGWSYSSLIRSRPPLQRLRASVRRASCRTAVPTRWSTTAMCVWP